MQISNQKSASQLSSQEDWTIWLKVQRRRAITIILGIVATLGLFGLGLSFITMLQGKSINFPAYLIVYIAIIALIGFSMRTSEKPVSWALMLIMFLFGMFSFHSGWLASGGRLFLVVTVVLAALFSTPSSALIVAGLSLLTYIGYALAYGSGLLALPNLPSPISFTPMFIEGVGFAITLSVVAISQWYFGQGLKAAARANRQAQKSSAGFHNIVERSTDGILVMDPQGMVLFVNQAAEKFFNRPRASWVGQPSGIAIQPGESSEIAIQRQGAQPGIAEVRLDETEWEGQPAYLAILRDISDRKQAELEREKLIADLEAKNAELERFTYTVSHDLKSPLVTITGFLSYLEKDALSGDMHKLRGDIQRIVDATSKMQALLQDLLELSRIGRVMNAPVSASFTHIAQEALALVHGALNERHITVQVADNLPAVVGDQTRLVEVVQNLLENAVKFMGSQPEPRIEIGSAGFTPENYPILFVRDNGIGIDARFKERIFGLFDKLDPHSAGTGIGLALVKRIVEVHGGRIWVESPGPGAGATFYFTLKPGEVSSQ